MKRIILLPLACMATTLLAQQHALRVPLTAEQVNQQALTRMINDEIQRRQQQACPEQYHQIAQQVSRQYSQFMNNPSQLDPRHTLPAMAAQAIEQKLDSVVQGGWKYTFQYDTERQLMLNATEYNLKNDQWEIYWSFDYVYDAQNRIIEEVENNAYSTRHSERTYNSSGLVTHFKSVNYQYDEQQNVVSAHGSDITNNDQGYREREADLAYDPAIGLYEKSATEYEYFDIPQGELYSNYIRKTTYYQCPGGSFTLEPYRRHTVQEDRLCNKDEQYIDGRWFTTYLSTMDDLGLTLTEESYIIENGLARLSSKTTETRYGWGDTYQSMQTRCRTEQYYDANGNITYGRKEDHLHDWGADIEVDHYRWDTSTRDWEIEYIDYLYYGEPYEGKTRMIVEYPLSSSTTQIYHNGQWETIEFRGSLEVVPVVPYGNPGFGYGYYRDIHYLNYSIDASTGNYKTYSETFAKHENGRIISEDTYDMPNRTNLLYRYEYDYNPAGDRAETRFLNTETGTLELRYRDIYEYDPAISTNQILHSGNTNYDMRLGNYYNIYDLSSYHAKPLSVKRYDAAGNVMEDLILYYYSSLHGDTNEDLSEITSDTPYGDQNTYLNLMGQPLASPLSGQPMIDVRHRQVIVR